MATMQTGAAGTPGDFVGRTVGRFVIKSAVGAGGMGEVYLAEDTTLHRDVAVKRLSPALRADSEARRHILREAQRSSALHSPHIASVYDVVEDGDELLLVMEYVEGKPLRHRMRALRTWPVSEFLEIAVQCANALAAAHSHGIVHRDIKPENIMVSDGGLVKVLDFGLARQVRTVDESAATVSVPSVSDYAGTPGYIAPEVLRNEAADTRGDIFSLGVVFYEMLSGEHPFRGANPALTTDRILHEDPKPLAKTIAGCPPELERIISKMLAKNPAERYATAADLAVDLRALERGVPRPAPRVSLRWRVLMAIAAATLVVGAILLVPTKTNHRPAFTERDWVLIADFDNVGADPIFDRTMNEALTIALQQSSYVNVLPRERIFAALERMERKDTTRVTEALGREISLRENVQVLLTGSIQRSGEAFQIRVRAEEPRNGKLLFAAEQRFARKEEVFERVDALASEVRRELGESLPQIGKSNQPLAKVTTSSLEALQLYSRGLDDLARAKIEPAAAKLQAALALSPNFAMAHYKLSVVYQTLGNRARESDEVEQAYALREHVTERERYIVEAAHYSNQGQDARAAESLEILVNRYPDDSEAQFELAAIHRSLGDYGKAIADLRQVIRLNPFFSEAYGALALNLAHTDADDEALQVYSAGVSKFGTTPRLEWARAMALFNLERLDEARSVLTAIENDPGYGNIARIYLARVDIYEGKFESAARRLNTDLRADLANGNRSPEVLRRCLLARIYLLQDRTAPAIAQLARVENGAGSGSFQGPELRWIGTAYAQMGNLPAARRVAQRLAKMIGSNHDPYDANALLTLQAEIALAEGQVEQSAKTFEKAEAAMPSSWAHSGLARAYMRDNQWPSAAAEWQKVLGAKGEILRDGFSADWVLAHLELARVYRRQGDVPQARAHYQALLRIWSSGDNIPARRQAELELQQLDSR